MKLPALLETHSFLKVKERVSEAAYHGVNSLIYGPPSSEKSFALKAAAERLRAAGQPVIYAYCGPRCTESFLYRTIAEAEKLTVRSSMRWANRYAVISHLQGQPKLPAIILDEAQHLDIEALEGVRQIHDLTSRPGGERGCGIVLAGSHSLLHFFLHPQRRLRLEQLLSRIPHRVQLEGMSKDEVLTLAARTFGNGKPAKLSEAQQKVLLQECSVVDPYHMDADGKATARTYYSSRRLLEFVRQQLSGKSAMGEGERGVKEAQHEHNHEEATQDFASALFTQPA